MLILLTSLSGRLSSMLHSGALFVLLLLSRRSSFCLCLSVCLSVSTVTQRIVDEFWKKLEDWELWLATNSYILVLIEIMMWVQEYFRGNFTTVWLGNGKNVFCIQFQTQVLRCLEGMSVLVKVCAAVSDLLALVAVVVLYLPNNR